MGDPKVCLDMIERVWSISGPTQPRPLWTRPRSTPRGSCVLSPLTRCVRRAGFLVVGSQLGMVLQAIGPYGPCDRLQPCCFLGCEPCTQSVVFFSFYGECSVNA